MGRGYRTQKDGRDGGRQPQLAALGWWVDLPIPILSDQGTGWAQAQHRRCHRHQRLHHHPIHPSIHPSIRAGGRGVHVSIM